MQQNNPFEDEDSVSEGFISGSLISSYEMAILSTLFNQEDCKKVEALASQWGYQQELLQAVWEKIHANIIGQRLNPIKESESRIQKLEENEGFKL